MNHRGPGPRSGANKTPPQRRLLKKPETLARSGRFTAPPHPDLVRFTESVSFDWRLWKQDIVGSMAHAAMLQKIGVLTRLECRAIVRGLEEIGQEIASGKFHWNTQLEDVHMNIEAALTRRVPAGAKLHTGRSRNDQVALDLRLWLMEEMRGVAGEIAQLQKALLKCAQDSAGIAIPGYTHLQRAQPVLLAHHWLAYLEMFQRDRDRLVDCFDRVNVCPLGSGALAGSTLPLDRNLVARLLGFRGSRGEVRLTQNSLDAVGDRDFVIEFCSLAALISIHLSRLAEDLIIWSTAEFDFITIGDAFTTGSSLMPQKKNPDIAELTRGKTARVIGNLMTLLTLLKGLPMSYNRDLQEGNERLFDTTDTVRACLRLTAGMLGAITVNPAACAAAVAHPVLLTTDLADWLVQRGVPFRTAHHLVGKVIQRAEGLNKPLNELTLEQMREISPAFERDCLNIFHLDEALARRNLTGAPGPAEVRKRIEHWDRFLIKAAPPGRALVRGR